MLVRVDVVVVRVSVGVAQVSESCFSKPAGAASVAALWNAAFFAATALLRLKQWESIAPMTELLLQLHDDDLQYIGVERMFMVRNIPSTPSHGNT